MTSRRTAFTLLELLVVIAIIVVLVGIILAVGAALGSAGDRTRTETTLQILSGALDEWENKSNRSLTWGADGYLFNGATLDRAVYDMQSYDPGPEAPNNRQRSHVFLVTEVLNTVARSSDIREVLAQIDDEHLITYNPAQSHEWLRAGYIGKDGQGACEPDLNWNGWEAEMQDTNMPWAGGLTVLDAWDRPIRVVHPGREWQPTDVFANPPFNSAPDADGTIRTPYENVYGVCVNARPFFVSSGPDRAFGDLSGNAINVEAASDNIYSYEVQKP